MPLQLQLRQARENLGIKGVSGVCHDSDKFVDQINTATRQLMKRGGWYGLEVLMRFCIYGCHIVLPRHVGTVIGVKTRCGQADIKNHWYHIVGPSCNDLDWHPFLINSNPVAVDGGQTPVFNEVSGTTGKQIAYHVTKNEDIGKTIRIFGRDENGMPLQTKNADGIWEDGIVIVAIKAGGSPGDVGTILPAMSTKLVTKITHVVREATQGMTFLYEYGLDANSVLNLRDLAMYEPNETHPMYRKLNITGYCGIPGATDENGLTRKTIDCMVKLQFIPVQNDWDFLLIDDLDSLRYAITAVKRDEAGEDDKAEISWGKAIRELAFNDRDKTPSQQISVKIRPMGSNRIITNPI